MNRKIAVLLLCTLLLTAPKSFSQDAKLYFMRLTGNQGSLTAFKAFVDETLVCRLNNNRYSVHNIMSGTRKVSVQISGMELKKRASSVTIDVEAGKTYYVLMFVRPLERSNDLFAVEVTGNSAKTILPVMLMDSQCLSNKDKQKD